MPHLRPGSSLAALATFGSGRVNTRFPPYKLREGDNRRIEKDPGYR
jgi:hypothetical protein